MGVGPDSAVDRTQVYVIPRAWHGVFQNWQDALVALAQPVAPPQLQVPLMDETGLATRAWGRGFFQDVYTALLAAGATKLPPPQVNTLMAFNNGQLTWAWIGWMVSVYDAFAVLGQPTSPPPIQTAITSENQAT